LSPFADRMSLHDFEWRKKKVWDEVVADAGLGFPLARDFRDYVEREEVGDPKDYIDGDPEGQEEYLESLRSVAKRYVTALSLIRFKNEPSDTKNERLSMSKQLHRGPFERRFRLVGFVLDCWERYGRSYIPWRHITAEWNKANPHSPIVSKDSFERAYRRAIKEDGIMIQLLVIRASKANVSIGNLAKTIEREQDRLASREYKELSDADRGRDGEPILSLLYKHYLLTHKQEVSKRRRDIMLSLAERYEQLAEAEGGITERADHNARSQGLKDQAVQ